MYKCLLIIRIKGPRNCVFPFKPADNIPDTCYRLCYIPGVTAVCIGIGALPAGS